MIRRVQGIVDKIVNAQDKSTRRKRIQRYVSSGRVPWSEGYWEFKEVEITKALADTPKEFVRWGKGLDERIVEIPWTIQNLSDKSARLLDAGSSLNHSYVLDHPRIKMKDLSIVTLFPESYNRIEQRISYVFGDLRELPFKDAWFDEIACISTLEHIDMDNSMYGAVEEGKKEKSFEYLQAVNEFQRVLKRNGTMLISVPYGKYENHGFFQQFDAEMLERMIDLLETDGHVDRYFFKYGRDGWSPADQSDCNDLQSFNPHTGQGKLDDGAAHSRSVACLKFLKSR